MRHLSYLLRRALIASFDDGLFTIAKGAAYSALLSMFPVLASAATILTQMRAAYVQPKVEVLLARSPPPGNQSTVLTQSR